MKINRPQRYHKAVRVYSGGRPQSDSVSGERNVLQSRAGAFCWAWSHTIDKICVSGIRSKKTSTA